MRALCLLALIGATLSGCCSTHRAWSDGYGSCVPQCDSGCPTPHQSCLSKSCLFKKTSSRSRCSSCSPFGNPCGSDYGSSCEGCGSSCGSDFGGCTSCAGGMMSDGMATGGCASCAQGQTAFDGSTYSLMPESSICPTCHQNHLTPTPSSSNYSPTPTQSVAPPPPTPPSTAPIVTPDAPEPSAARMMQPMPIRGVQMQPLRMLPTQNQPVQYQEWQSHQAQPQGMAPYNPPAQAAPQPNQSAVQPVLWVPAQTQPPAPLLMPAP